MATLEEIKKELEEIPLTEHEWDIVEWLIDEVKRLRRQLENEHRSRKDRRRNDEMCHLP